jgi:hemerythrin
MAKILTWRDEWTLRIDVLDDDHRGIVDMLLHVARRFGDESERQETPGQDGDEGDLYAALDGLGSFTRQHFRREEEFMRTIDYPQLGNHSSEHALLMAEHTALVRELRKRGIKRLGPKELETLKHWVVAHILGADRGFTDHYFKICGADPRKP